MQFLLVGGEPPGLDTLTLAREFKGGYCNKIIGLCQLCELVFGRFEFKKSKRSSEVALIIIHVMLTDPNYKFSKHSQEVFVGLESKYYRQLDFGKHYNNHIAQNFSWKP